MSFLKNIQQDLKDGLIILSASMLMVVPAYAATTTYTVTSTNNSAAAAACAGGPTAFTCGTLRDALTAANALPASPGDDISVVFQAGLTGNITYNNANQRMFTAAVGVDNTISNGQGAVFLINAQRPVDLNFGSRVGTDATGAPIPSAAMLYIASSSVIVENFDVASGVISAQTGIVVGNVQNTTIRNGRSLGVSTGLDNCIAILDGASNVSVTNYVCNGGSNSGLYIDHSSAANLGVSNITLSNVQFSGTTGGATGGDILVGSETAANAGKYTKVSNMSVANSTFSSPAAGGVSNSIIFRGGSIITNFSVSNSQFTGTGTRAVYVEDSPDLGFGTTHTVSTTNLSIKNNTFTNTGEMLRMYAITPAVNDAARATHTGLVVQGNTMNNPTCSTNVCGLIHLAGDIAGTRVNNALIENNQFFNQQASANGAGIYNLLSGTNNVVRNNTFNAGTIQSLYAYYSEAASAGASTGWTVNNNNVLNYAIVGNAPIFLNGNGDTIAYGNTFGAGTTGAAVGDLSPETGAASFLTNNLAGSNNQIQTWRPTAAQFGGAVTVTVAPVNPAVGGKSVNVTANPVFIDVYYTATDKAEVYLGRIPGTFTAATTYTFVTDVAKTVGAGAVRAQITDSVTNESSQYSAAVKMTPDQGLIARGVGVGSMGGGLLAILGGLALLRRRLMASLLGVLALTTAFSANAAGKDWTDKLYGGANFGYLKTDFDAQALKSHLNAKPGYGVSDVQVDHNGIGGGLWLGYALNPSWGVEFSWTTGADEKVRFAGTVPGLDQAVKDASPDLIGYGDAYQLRLRYNKVFCNDWVLSPHAGIGFTWTNQSFESGATGQRATLDDVSFSYNLGGSINYVINRDWSVGLSGDFHQVPGHGLFGLVAAVVEWRMPMAFGIR